MAKSKTKLGLPKEQCLKMLDLMIKSRVLEERLIKIYKAGEGFFWIGGPGEEAWGVPLGMHINKGQGIDHDYLHFHYRCTPTLVAMGMPMIDPIRLMMNKSTDTSSGGRNFAGHYCYPEWNVVPVSSCIGVQYSMAIGSARVQQREKSKGITVVSGGDAGTAEGDFATCLVWASRRGNELPMLITVQNNKMGISTNYNEQHGEDFIADRGKAFNMKTMVINGNDPVETYIKLDEAMTYIRKNKKPVLLEAQVSRLYGHSSADGANLKDDFCCNTEFSKKLLQQGWITEKEITEKIDQYTKEGRKAQEQVRTEPSPKADTVWDHVWVDNENADWRKF